MTGNFVAEKKSSLFKCPSLSALLVEMESTFASKLIFASLKSAKSDSMVASNFAKLPETFVIIKCFTLKVISLCAASIL